MMKIVVTLLIALMAAASLVAQTMPVISQSRPLAFTHVTVIDVTGEKPKPDMTVLIRGNRIEAMGPTATTRLPKGARVVDATGRFMLPGLWDMHMHLSLVTELAIPLLIANGVTGVRDMGGDLDRIAQWRREIASAKMLGPRIVMAGPIVDGPRTEEGQFRLTVTSPADGRQAVVSLKRRGVDFIKVYHFLARESYFAVADEAKKQGLTFAGHIPNGVSAAEASDAGQSSIEHVVILIQAYIALADKRGRTTKELTEEALAAYNGDEGRLIFQRFVKNGTWHVPTMVVARSFLLRPELAARPDPRRNYVAALAKRHWEKNNPVPRNTSAEEMAERRLAFQKVIELVGTMRRAGVAMMTGTDPPTRDVFPGFSVHDELALFVQAGMTPLEALRTATYNPAKYLGLLDSLGTVERGKIADLLLLEADPLENISNTQRISAVVVNGKYLPKKRLQKMLADVEAVAGKQ
ncbi:MAG TPA: amidohydrolase family protein [Pyrinomonadaceae bacterium]|nr:amidohydrolase family protein [Pyrinomonadaceae bacterium]